MAENACESRDINGIEAAISPSVAIDIVEKHFSQTGQAISVKQCEVRRVRPTREGHLELEYRFRITKPGTGRTFTAMVLGTIYSDDSGAREYKKLSSRSKAQSHFARPDLNGFALYAPELRLLLRSPSTDAKLSGLKAALDSEAMKPLLTGYINADASGRGAIDICEVDILRYRAGRRCTVRYRLKPSAAHNGNFRERGLIGKIYAEMGEDTFRVMRELDRKGFGEGCPDGIRIPRPLDYISELQMLLMEEVPGLSMTKSYSSPHLVEHLKAAGRALAKIHACPLKLARTYRAEDEVLSSRRWVSKATRLNPELSGTFEESLRAIAESSCNIRCDETTLVHGDYHHKQVLIGDDEVTVVDFDTACNADPAIDVGNFLAHVKCKEIELCWSKQQARRNYEAFLTAYSESLGPNLTRRIDYYYRTSLLQITCLVSLRPKKRHLTAAMLAEGMSAVSFM